MRKQGYADRSDHGCLASPKSCNPDIELKKAPSEYLKQIYFDSVVFTPEAIRHLVAEVGAGQAKVSFRSADAINQTMSRVSIRQRFGRTGDSTVLLP